ncbi:unnamed protein product [Heligmosomoides polygyrus]|uniref:GAT domain-containing protein n=1 Tax=Heligmosomoides polygyrus TaxID=6339 RepID=A0A183F342_HELPZ|nr:unnamed protein product [Heligmosomoides polygyrus]
MKLQPDRDLMAKLVDAFDMMTAQETAFLGVLKNIVDIHEQATSDLAAENETSDAKGEGEGREGLPTGCQDVAVSKNGESEDEEQDEEMIRETLRELEQVSLQAVAAAELNEKLVETLQRHKKNVRFNSLITYRC